MGKRFFPITAATMVAMVVACESNTRPRTADTLPAAADTLARYTARVLQNAGDLIGSARINAAGLVIGTVGSPLGGGRHAVLWKDGVPTVLPAPAGGSYEANAINDAGVIAGDYTVNDPFCVYPVTWNGASTPRAVTPAACAYATAINNRGDVLLSNNTLLMDGRAVSLLPVADSFGTTTAFTALNDRRELVGSRCVDHTSTGGAPSMGCSTVYVAVPGGPVTTGASATRVPNAALTMPIFYDTYYRINNRGHRLRGSGTSNPYFFAIERPDLHDTLNVNAAFTQPSQLTLLSVIGLTDDDRVVVIPWSYTGEATTGWLWSPTRVKRILVSNLSVQAMTPIDLNEAGQILARLHLADSTYVLAVLTPSS